MTERSFGWVQEAYKIGNLKKIVKIFVCGSDINESLRFDKIPRLISEEYGRDTFIAELSKEEIILPYAHLKGKGTPAGDTRATAPCSGIAQAAVPGQKQGKEYQSDWSADSFLRWGIAIGFLDYDRSADTCSLSESGRKFACSEDGGDEEEQILTEAFLSYPPLCRVLSLLADGGHMTKFEIGRSLGFIGEAGFTSIPQTLIIQGLSSAANAEERNKLLSNTEGTSDKYVRTICSWMKQTDWVRQAPKSVTAEFCGQQITDTIPQAYQITLKGRNVLNRICGGSRHARVSKRVAWDMLATKAPGRNYLRSRRAHLLTCLTGGFRTLEFLSDYIRKYGFEDSLETITDDIKGFENIGLNVVKNGGQYRIADDIIGLDIPAGADISLKDDFAVLKDAVREKLKTLDHKYLVLIDLGFDSNANRDYEIQTAELLTSELHFSGARLGGSRKPDVCVYYGRDGLIIDNKAYSKGYSLPMQQADEMVRYLEENKTRDKTVNPNEWWKIFADSVSDFKCAFISGEFTSGFKDRLLNIYNRTGVPCGAINSVNLLLLAEELKAGRMKYQDCFRLFAGNEEIIIQSS